MSDSYADAGWEAAKKAQDERTAELREQLARATAAEASAAQKASALPTGIMTKDEMEAHEAKGERRYAGMTHAQQMEANSRYIDSYAYYARQGQ